LSAAAAQLPPRLNRFTWSPRFGGAVNTESLVQPLRNTRRPAAAGRCGFPQQLLPADFRGHDRVLGNMVVTRRLSLMLTARGEEVLTYAQIWSELTRKLARHGNRDPYLRYERSPVITV
jgi:hypothetical protein